MTPWSVAFKTMLVTSQLESSSLYSIAVESLERLGDVAMGCGPILEAQSLNYLSTSILQLHPLPFDSPVATSPSAPRRVQEPC